MVDVVNKAYQFIRLLFDNELGARLLLQLADHDPLPNWQNPQ